MASRRLLATLVLVLAAPAALAETSVRAYAVPGHGVLELDVPLSWRETIDWTPGDHRPTIRLQPRDGAAFVATVEVLPPPLGAPADFGTSAWLRSIVEESARGTLGIPRDRELFLQELGRGATVGWYFSVTDESLPDPPPAGAHRTMIQGASRAGSVVLTATILLGPGGAATADDALALLRTARTGTGPPDAWRVPDPGSVAAGAPDERCDFDVPDGFEHLAAQPMRLRDTLTGGLLEIRVEPRPPAAAGHRASTVRAELRRLEAETERRSPGAWLTRRRDTTLLGGRPAARLVIVDELRDEEVTSLALPLEDAVMTLTWRVHPTRARDAEARLRPLLETFKLR